LGEGKIQKSTGGRPNFRKLILRPICGPPKQTIMGGEKKSHRRLLEKASRSLHGGVKKLRKGLHTREELSSYAAKQKEIVPGDGLICGGRGRARPQLTLKEAPKPWKKE